MLNLEQILTLHAEWLADHTKGKQAKFIKTDLRNIHLERADLRYADFRGADLRSAHLAHANLAGANLNEANLLGASLYDVDLTGASLESANLAYAAGLRAKFDGASMAFADAHGSTFNDATFVNAELAGANFLGARLVGADLRNAHLAAANLAGADLIRATLRDANLGGALSMNAANFCGADTDEADLILGGLDRRGFLFYAYGSKEDVIIIRAGCRRYVGMSEARDHWQERHLHSDSLLHLDVQLLLDRIEKLAIAREWKLEETR